MSGASHQFEATVLDRQDRFAAMTDEQVRDAYLASIAGAGDVEEDALAAEICARNIDL